MSDLVTHGRVSYMQIPAVNVRESAEFYAAVFGWKIRGGGEAHLSFDDAAGDLIGAWVTHLAPSRDPGVLPYIYVNGIDAAVERIAANGGRWSNPRTPRETCGRQPFVTPRET